MDLSNFKRAWLLSDTHFGIKNGSVEWVNIQQEYFSNFFIPLIKREKKEGDFIIHCGDVFDSRHSLGLYTINFTMKIFEELSKILPVTIIIGNHDIYNKMCNDINSVKILRWIPNVKIFEEPEIIKICGKKSLMMPWRINHEEESKCLKENPADFLFCHTDVQGLKFNRNTEIQSGITLDDLKQFRKVYSGHIHFSQSKGNFRMLGCPYQLTRSDVNNEKGVWCFNFETEEEKFYVNDVSPKFIRMNFENMLEMDETEVVSMVKNNFVDIMTDMKWTLNFPFSTFYDDISGYRKLEFVNRISDDVEQECDSENEQLGKIDIVELASKLIQTTSHSDILKEKLLNTVKLLYESSQKTNEENEMDLLTDKK